MLGGKAISGIVVEIGGYGKVGEGVKGVRGWLGDKLLQRLG